MQVLFLDFDGVLNSHHHCLWERTQPLPPTPEPTSDPDVADIRRMVSQVDPRLIFNLGVILSHSPSLEIVISSSWRHAFRLPQFNQLFKYFGLPPDRVMAFTPTRLPGQKFSESVPRIAEIDTYRKEQKLDWDQCVVVDDHHVAQGHSDDSRWMPEDKEWVHRFVQTDQRDGLTYARAWDILDKLHGNRGWKAPVILM